MDSKAKGDEKSVKLGTSPKKEKTPKEKRRSKNLETKEEKKKQKALVKNKSSSSASKNPLIVKEITKTTELKPPKPHTVGFIGAGESGKCLINILVKEDISLIIWHDDPDFLESQKGDKVETAGLTGDMTLQDMVNECDIIFLFVLNEDVTKELFYKEFSFRKILRNKQLIDLTSSCPRVSLMMHDTVVDEGGSFLEAKLHGTLAELRDGRVTIFTSGDEEVFDASATYLRAWAKKVCYLGPAPGQACCISNLVSGMQAVNMIIECHSRMTYETLDNFTKKDFEDVLYMQALMPRLSDGKILDEREDIRYVKDIKKNLEYLLVRDPLEGLDGEKIWGTLFVMFNNIKIMTNPPEDITDIPMLCSDPTFVKEHQIEEV